MFSSDMTWKAHIDHIYSKASPRLYYLRQLRRCKLSNADLLMFYRSVIRPLLEYSCPAWHTGITKQDSEHLEHIQKGAMTVIHPGIPYENALTLSNLETLSSRRESLCQKFFAQIQQPDHKLNYLLQKRHKVPYDLRHAQPYDIITPHTERYKNSFIMHGLINYT